MTTKERKAMRRTQDKFLAHPKIVKTIAEKGWDTPFIWGKGSATGEPTYAEIRDMLYPKWLPWMVSFLNDQL